MTLSEFISAATRALEAVGIESGRLEAELLLCTALGVDRKKLFLETKSQLSAADLARANELLELRKTRFPLQYIMGTIEFLGLSFSVKPGVFIPRPETETLVEEARKILGGLESPAILEIGTGSGVVVVTLAVLFPGATVYATDVSPLAIAVGSENAGRHGVAGRVSFLLRDVRSPAGNESRECSVDMIVSNPPYIPGPEIPFLEPEVSKYEPREAQDGGLDGLDLVRAIAGRSRDFLKPGGWLLLEIGAGQAESAAGIVASAGLASVRIVKDLAGRDRVLVAMKE